MSRSPVPTDHKAALAAALSTQFSRRRLLAAAGAGLLSASAAGLAQAQGTPKKGGTLTLAWVEAIDTLDPHLTSSAGAIKVINNVFNGLLKVSYDGKSVSFEPDLAEKWDMPDEKTHVFKLRPGVKFHNGDACDAEAVKWSLERVKSPALKSPHAWKLELLEHIDVVDPLTVRLRFRKPFAFLPVALTGSTGRAGTIVNRRAVEAAGAGFGRAPVGTGPFKLVGWKENDSIELQRNPAYFEPGRPHLDRVLIKLIKEPSAAVAALMSGQVDGLSVCPFQFIPQLRKNPSLQVLGQVEGNYAFLGMNNKRAPFNDIALRQAVAFAIDRRVIVQQSYFGEAIPAYTCISPPMSQFYDPGIAKSGRGQFLDLAKAKALRAKAKVQGEINPVYIVTEGFTGSGGLGTRNAQLIAPMLAQIGIKPKIELVDRAIWLQRRNAGDFDLYDEAWVADLDPDETITPEWSTGKPWNFVGYRNPKFDEAVKAAAETTDVARRRRLYIEAEDVLMADAPLAVLAHMKVFKILSRKVRGFEYVPADLLNLHDVWLA
ncbi:peptide ABC transporter substrate-binding protein [Rubrivivax gelatinosus]|uniref:Peptide ABC transporter substrate-binding protein n=1 Tax=Rubrivivax gelatinosus TaxID=28068 RepID=A0ABS1DYJ2_RUBGE|nr:ABC transporter substrate-binding protein [Rubrivivax gelatinosus]MBK1614523.1 peptide ABC transporter substrate-binding protein [Rubrivivax gelatinosus]MBK1715164.1 peptide ABC transporter substrate-binding protein [Rubrivivax gelatinosus]MBZ8143058.1 peptide ABC transporter substrate-binding protein [Rubrivivax gelatinosus]